jgi:PAS domain S-box-containing protein
LNEFLSDPALRAGTVSSTVARGRYFDRLERTFNSLKGKCSDLLKLNQDAMLTKSNAAGDSARRWFWLTLILSVSLAVGGLILAFVFADRIIRPIRELTAVTAKIAGGNLDVKASVDSRDEIGLLAAEFNRMAERIRQLRRSDLGRVLAAQQTTEAAIDSLFDPVLVIDAQGRIAKLNRAAEEIFGSESQKIGQSIAEVARDNRIEAAVNQALDSQCAVSSENVAAALPLKVSGVERAFRLRVTPMRDEDQVRMGAVVLLEDITHLREIDRLKTDFIAVASHELRAPLTNVQMGIHVLLDGVVGELSDQQLDILYNCRQDCDKLEKLMRDLLDLSTLEAGKLIVHHTPIDLGPSLAATLDSLKLLAQSKGLAFKTIIPSGLPLVLADSAQIERVLINLVNNAVRYTPRGGEITVTATRQNDFISISVADTGSGSPAEYLPRIFDRFARVPEAQKNGHGLGLAISKRLIESLGGQITVQSEVDRGTIFAFTLPCAQQTIAQN